MYVQPFGRVCAVPVAVDLTVEVVETLLEVTTVVVDDLTTVVVVESLEDVVVAFAVVVV